MTTATLDMSGAAEMVAAGNSQITEITSAIDKLDTRIADAKEEILALKDAHEARGSAITAARSEWERLQLISEQAQGYATFAYKLPHQNKAVREAAAAKKAATEARKRAWSRS